MDNTFEEYWQLIKRYWWIVLLAFVGGWIGVGVTWARFTTTYVAANTAVVTNYLIPNSQGAKSIGEYYSRFSQGSASVTQAGPFVVVSSTHINQETAEQTSREAIEFIIKDFRERQDLSIKALSDSLKQYNNKELDDGDTTRSSQITAMIADTLDLKIVNSSSVEIKFQLWTYLSISMLVNLFIGGIGIVFIEMFRGREEGDWRSTYD